MNSESFFCISVAIIFIAFTSCIKENEKEVTKRYEIKMSKSCASKK